MDSSDEKRREEIEDWDLDELFFEKEKQIQEELIQTAGKLRKVLQGKVL